MLIRGFLLVAGLTFLSSCNLFQNREGELSFSVNDHPNGDPLAQSIQDPGSSTLRDSTSFNRTNGLATAVRLKAIFSDADSQEAIDDTIFNTDNETKGTASQRTVADAIMSRERLTAPTTLAAFMDLIGGLCKDRADSLFVEEATGTLESVWTSGESVSATGWSRKSLVAARRAWLYPVPETDASVASISGLASALESGGSDEGLVKSAICRVVFEAPQFWLGVPAEKFWVTRMALEMGLRLPTRQEYSDALSGRLTPEDLATRIQAEPGYLAAVKRWHQDWLDFGAPGLTISTTGGPVIHLPPFQRYDSASGASGYGGLKMKLRTAGVGSNPIKIYKADGSVADANAKVMISAEGTHLHNFSKDFPGGDKFGPLENCLPVEQEFDPSVGKVSIEFWDGTNWKEAASQVHNELYVGDFESRTGSYTPALSEFGPTGAWRGTSSASSSSEAAFPSLTYEKGGATRTFTTEFRPATTLAYDKIPLLVPLEGMPSVKLTHKIHPWGWRVRRFVKTTSGGWGDEQYGMSQIRLPWSGERVWVCNAFTRIASSCNFHPQDGTGAYVPRKTSYSSGVDVSLRNVLKTDPRASTSDSSTWSYASGFSYANLQKKSFGFTKTFLGESLSGTDAAKTNGVRDDGWLSKVERGFASGGAFANYRLLNMFYCGKPDVADLSSGTDLIDLSSTVFRRSGPYQDVATNVSIDVTESETLADETSEERGAILSIGEDMAEEPFRLIEHLATGGVDYRELLTAKYSYGRKPLFYYYQTQGYALPDEIPEAAHKPSDSDFIDGEVIRFSQSDFVTFSRRWIQTWMRSTGGTSSSLFNWYDDPPASSSGTVDRSRYPIHGRLSSIQPRPMAGILTQAAFIGPVAPKVRTLVSRIYMRLMCSNPAALALTDDQQESHEALVYSDVHLRSDCFSCHRHIDPAARALSHLFGMAVSGGRWVDDELEDALYTFQGENLGFQNDSSSRYFWGIRGTTGLEPFEVSGRMRGKGLFMGKEVAGIEQLANEVANTREFAQCVTLQTLRGLYGRTESAEDLPMITEAVDKFMDPSQFNYRYNELVKFLATQPHFYSVQ